MKILIINSVCGFGSTGRIAVNIARDFEEQGQEAKIAYGRKSVGTENKVLSKKIGNWFSVSLHFVSTKLFDRHGLGSVYTTRRFLRWAERYDPDILWMHNIHGYYINYKELFKWIKSRPDMEVRWTLHDCWAFTGHCSHFSGVGCTQWKTGCCGCASKRSYPSSYFLDRSKKNYIDKKRSFTGVKKLKIIAPSNWLADCVKDSFLKEYDVEIIHNKVNEMIFRPVEDKFMVKQIYQKYLGTNDYGRKKILLGVAGAWTKAKGYEDFIKLSELLPDDYQIVLVGLSSKQMQKIPDGIKGISWVSKQEELCLLYNGALYYVNLTYEDTFPTTNLEAVACKVPVITYDTGGCRETVGKNDHVVEVGDVERVAEIIQG